MRIALITENSQAAKNGVIHDSLVQATADKGYEVVNYGMYSPEDDNQLTYVQNGLLAAILLGSGAADFVVTGCGTGVGAMLACNSFPGVTCGLVIDPTDAYLFSQVNGGNAVSLPYAKGFGWGAELNLVMVFRELFREEPGGGYPRERAVPEQRNARILAEVKEVTYRPLVDVLTEIDQDLLRGAIGGERFREHFEAAAEPGPIRDLVLGLLD